MLAAAAVLSLCCCNSGGRLIPRSDFSAIYADMMMLDQHLQMDRPSRRQADTLAVYEAVFEKYGYSREDFLYSEREYIKDAGRYVRMLKKAVVSLEKEGRALKAEKSRLDKIREAAANVRRFAPERIYFLADVNDPEVFTHDSVRYHVDSAGGVWNFEKYWIKDTLVYEFM